MFFVWNELLLAYFLYFTACVSFIRNITFLFFLFGFSVIFFLFGFLSFFVFVLFCVVEQTLQRTRGVGSLTLASTLAAELGVRRHDNGGGVK